MYDRVFGSRDGTVRNEYSRPRLRISLYPETPTHDSTVNRGRGEPTRVV